MSLIGRLSSADSQNVCSRRELPGRLFAIAGALLLPDRQSRISVSQTEVQPKFKVGDLIASDWLDEFDENMTDFGEIMGMRWVTQPDSFSSSPKTWVYFVRWTHSTSGCYSCYPCYDGEPSDECDLRLVS